MFYEIYLKGRELPVIVEMGRAHRSDDGDQMFIYNAAPHDRHVATIFTSEIQAILIRTTEEIQAMYPDQVTVVEPKPISHS
jgi:hypothetical protein